MSKLMAALMAGAFCVSVAQAQGMKPVDKATSEAALKSRTAQQNKMGICNKEAADKKLAGDARKQFMSSCLRGGAAMPGKPPLAKPPMPTSPMFKPPMAKPTDQKQKIGYCNKEAFTKQLKGDERKKFMSECLKKG